jgi:PAS domain S-box-containing protein
MAPIIEKSGLVGVKLRQAAVVLALAAVYIATARLGLLLALPPEKKATAVWPPSGIALAALLLLGFRVWQGVWLGAFLANMLDYFSHDNQFSLTAHLLVSAGIATGSTLQALAGSFLIRRWIGPGSPFDRAAHAFTFAGVAMLMCLIAATCGVASLYLGGFAPGRAVGFIWWTWWLGDMTGVLTVGALLLTWSHRPRFVREPRRLMEAALFLALLLALASAIFGIMSPVVTLPTPLAYLTVPFLVWATFRFGLHGAATTLFLLSAVAVLGTAQGTGPFTQPTVQASLLLLQVFMGAIAVTALVMAAVLNERRTAEARMGESEERHRLLTEALPHMVWAMRPDLTVDFLNRRSSEFTGLTVEQVKAGGWERLIHPDDLPKMLATVSGPLERGEPHEAEYRFLHHTGEYRWVVSRAVPLKNEAGAVVKWIGTTLDIHDRWLAERQFRLAVEASPVGVFLADPEGKIVLANSPFEQMFGYDRGELLGELIERLIPQRYRDRHPGYRSGYFADPQTRPMGGGRDLWGRRKDGSEVPVEIGLKPVQMDDGLHVLASVIDISERRQADDALRESESRFRFLAETIPCLVWTSRPDGYNDFLNRRWIEYTGLTLEQSQGEGWARVLHPDDLERTISRWLHSLRTGEGYHIEYRLRRGSDGSYRWFLAQGQPMRNEAGQVVRWFGACTDIDDQKRAEEQLRSLNASLERRVAERTEAIREQEERFRSAFDNAPIGLALVAPDGRWLRVNRSLSEIVGYTEAELLATDYRRITHPGDLEADLGHIRAMLAGAIRSYQMEKRYFHKQGQVVHTLVSRSLVRDAEGGPLYFISQIQDITKRKEVEALAAANAALLRQFIKHSPAAIAMFDRSMRYLQCSDRWLADYHLTGRDITGFEPLRDLSGHPGAVEGGSPEGAGRGRRDVRRRPLPPGRRLDDVAPVGMPAVAQRCRRDRGHHHVRPGHHRTEAGRRAAPGIAAGEGSSAQGNPPPRQEQLADRLHPARPAIRPHAGPASAGDVQGEPGPGPVDGADPRAPVPLPRPGPCQLQRLHPPTGRRPVPQLQDVRGYGRAARGGDRAAAAHRHRHPLWAAPQRTHVQLLQARLRRRLGRLDQGRAPQRRPPEHPHGGGQWGWVPVQPRLPQHHLLRVAVGPHAG